MDKYKYKVTFTVIYAVSVKANMHIRKIKRYASFPTAQLSSFSNA